MQDHMMKVLQTFITLCPELMLEGATNTITVNEVPILKTCLDNISKLLQESESYKDI